MFKVKILIATLAFGLSALSTSAKAELAIIDSVLWGDSTYHIIDAANWDDAEDRAIELGGHLITIDSQQENDFIYGYWGQSGTSEFFTTTYLWTGLNDAEVEGDFVWASGEDVSYTNFKLGEPNGYTHENYVYMWTRPDSIGTWNDFPGNRGVDYANGVFGVVEIKDFGNNASIVIQDVPAPYLLSFAFPLLFLLRKKITS